MPEPGAPVRTPDHVLTGEGARREDDVAAPPTRASLLQGRLAVANDRGLTPIAVVVLMVAVFYALNPGAVTVITLSALLDQSAALLLLAVAQGLVILMGRIDLANAAMASFLAVLFVNQFNEMGPPAIVVVLVLGIVLGALQGWVHMYFQVPSFVVTLAMMGIMGGAGIVASNASAVFVSNDLSMVQAIYASPGRLPVAFLLAAAVAVVFSLFVSRTTTGRAMRAVGLNQRASAYSGIRTTRVVVLAFASAGFLVALASIFTVAQLSTASAGIANSQLLAGIAAVVVGGTAISGGIGGPGRTIFGALIIALLRIGLDIVGVSTEYQPIIYGLIIIAAIAITVDRSRALSVA
jgi:ribose transport system permease protein